MNSPASDLLGAIRDALFFFWPIGLVLSVMLGVSGQAEVGFWIFLGDLAGAAILIAIYPLADWVQRSRIWVRPSADWPIRG